jgi:hypothetical protein
MIHWRAGIDGIDIGFVLSGVDGFNDAQMKLTDTNENEEPFGYASEHDIVPETSSSPHLWARL